MAPPCRASSNRHALRSLARVCAVTVCTALVESVSGCGAAVPAPGSAPAASTTSGAEPRLTLGGDATEEEPTASSTAAEQASACDAGQFWDGERCLPRRELLTSENVAQVVPRCEAGD